MSHSCPSPWNVRGSIVEPSWNHFADTVEPVEPDCKKVSPKCRWMETKLPWRGSIWDCPFRAAQSQWRFHWFHWFHWFHERTGLTVHRQRCHPRDYPSHEARKRWRFTRPASRREADHTGRPTIGVTARALASAGCAVCALGTADPRRSSPMDQPTVHPRSVNHPILCSLFTKLSRYFFISNQNRIFGQCSRLDPARY